MPPIQAESGVTHKNLRTIPKDSSIHAVETSFLSGDVFAPPSKSYTHRAIIIGSMNGKSQIHNILDSEDTRNTIKAWKKMGATLDETPDRLEITGFNGLPKFIRGAEINVGESGTLLRFILSVASLGVGKIRIDGSGTLVDRENTSIFHALKALGVEIKATGPDHTVPITITAKGEIEGGEITVDGSKSSQVVSSLLIALPLAKNNSLIKIEDSNKLVSRPYIDVTIDVLEKAGITVIKNNNYESFEVKGGQEFKSLDNFLVPGDYSSAAFIIAAASLIESKVKVQGLGDDAQGDKQIIDIINRMGGHIKRGKDFVEVEGPFDLEGIEVDCRDTPDIVPVIAALAVFAKGQTRIFNIPHLKEKESNRIKSIAKEFSKLGIKITTTDNEILINESKPKRGLTLDPHNDHRIAMCLSLIGLKNGDLTITDAKCIEKSYPSFIQDMQNLGAKIELEPMGM